MVMHKMTEEMEKGLPPEPAVIEGVGKLIEAAVKEKVFVSGEGLKPGFELGLTPRFCKGDEPAGPGSTRAPTFFPARTLFLPKRPRGCRRPGSLVFIRVCQTGFFETSRDA
jgi:hypothetical protein